MAVAHDAKHKQSRRERQIAPSRRPASVSPEDRRVQIAAARARIEIDKLTGDATPDWIIALSKEQPE
ncbi:hypothetical protein [Sinomonas sp. ASV322]|uniref:hypothetical protein n=1 Tax=Sinomonas sp. ASV322 TaxID=3041920 RepID=UPI0027DB60F5|nr:hypothetical protein [Sinomonas sp. ASV322]MDQ4501848.1 hypothetical protein [Sinomonas sp. ASV322]